MSRITTATLSAQDLNPVLGEPLGQARELHLAGKPLSFSVGRDRNSFTISRPTTVANVVEWTLRDHFAGGRVARDKIEALIQTARAITPRPSRNARASWRGVFAGMTDDEILGIALEIFAAAMVTELLSDPMIAQQELARRTSVRRRRRSARPA